MAGSPLPVFVPFEPARYREQGRKIDVPVGACKLVRYLSDMGVESFERPGFVNPHAFSAASRRIALWRVQDDIFSTTAACESKDVVVFYPRTAEVNWTARMNELTQGGAKFGDEYVRWANLTDTEKDLLSAQGLPRRTRFVAYRDQLFVGDQVHGRPLYTLEGWELRNELVAVFHDVYAYDFKELFRQTASLDNFGYERCTVYLSIRDFRGVANWESYDDYEAIWTRQGDDLTFFSSLLQKGVDGAYRHKVATDCFFEQLAGHFSHFDQIINYECHSFAVAGPYVCFKIVYYPSDNGLGVEPVFASRPVCAKIQKIGGMVLMPDLLPTIDTLRSTNVCVPGSTNHIMNVLDCELKRLVPSELRLVEPIRRALEDVRSSAFAVAQVVKEPVVAGAGAAAAASRHELRNTAEFYAHAYSVPSGVGTFVAELTKKQTTGEFVLTLWKGMSDAARWIVDCIRDLFGAAREVASIQLDLVKGLARLVQALKPTLVTTLHNKLASISWCRNLLSKQSALQAEYPVASALLEVITQIVSALWTAAGEETLKRLSLVHFIIFVVSEVAVWATVGYLEQERNVILRAVGRVLAHTLLVLIPFPAAVFFHMCVNLTTSYRHVMTGSTSWFQDHGLENTRQPDPPAFEEPELDVSGVSLVVGGTKFPMKGFLKQSWVYSGVREVQLPVVSCPAVARLARPANSVANELAAFALRNRVQFSVELEADLLRRWEPVKVLLVSWFQDHQKVSLWSFERVLTHLKGRVTPLRYQEYERAVTAHLRGFVVHRTEEAHVKTDEQLLVKQLSQKVKGLKVRTIISVPPENHVDLMRFTLAFKEQVVPVLNAAEPRPLNVRFNYSGLSDAELIKSPLPVSFAFAYGFTCDDLDAWFNTRVHKLGRHFIILCDDLYLLVGGLHTPVCMALDEAKYDKTCGLGAHEAKFELYRLLGCPEDIIDRAADLLGGTRRIRVHIPQVEEPVVMEWKQETSATATGAADTSLGGSIIHTGACLFTLKRDPTFSPDSVAKCFGELGLQPELETYAGSALMPAECGTFLRGRWILVDHRYRWVPLSAVKLLKTKRDPRDVFPGKSNPLAWYLAAVSQNAAFRRDPFWNEVLASFERYGKANCVDFKRAVDLYRVNSRGWEDHIIDNSMRVGAAFETFPDAVILRNYFLMASKSNKPLPTDLTLAREYFRVNQNFPVDVNFDCINWFLDITYA